MNERYAEIMNIYYDWMSSGPIRSNHKKKQELLIALILVHWGKIFKKNITIMLEDVKKYN